MFSGTEGMGGTRISPTVGNPRAELSVEEFRRRKQVGTMLVEVRAIGKLRQPQKRELSSC